jgi:hypothetical protein
MDTMNINDEFAVEELEPRLEMQMLGFGVDPSTVRNSLGKIVKVIIVRDSSGEIVDVL